jgi:hypothetical protein
MGRRRLRHPPPVTYQPLAHSSWPPLNSQGKLDFVYVIEIHEMSRSGSRMGLAASNQKC